MVKRVFIVSLFIASFIVGTLVLSSSSSDNEDNDTPGASFNSHYAITSVPMPASISFADEPVPITNFDVYESLDKELLVNTYWQSQTLLFIKKAYKYFPVIEPILKEVGVPDDFKYLALAESGLSNVTSPAGAEGFWQLLEGTARDYKLEVNDEVDERYHLEKATRAAAEFLKDSYQKYGTWTMAAASYNMGRRNISRQMSRQKASNYYDLVLGDETGRYVYRLLAIKLILESPQDYGFFIKPEQGYKNIPFYMVSVDTTIESMPDFAHSLGINYKVLKELNPWLREDRLSNRYKKTYEIKIVDTAYRKVSVDTAFYKN